MANYLVTGIAGFIGSSVAAALLARGHRVTGLDDLSSGHEENVPSGAVFVRGNCLDEGLYAALQPKGLYDAILHLAGRDDTGFGPEGALADMRANTESTLRLLDFALSTGCSRFIYRSSASVYGPQPDIALTESAVPRPVSCSGISRLAAESYLALYAKRGILPTVLRLFEPYGPMSGRFGARRSLPAILIEMLIQNRHIQVNGSPNRCRDFVHIEDVTRAFLACLDRPQSIGRVINVGGSGKIMVGDLVDRVAALSEHPVTVEYAGCSKTDDFGVHADISMAAKYLGYDPEMGLNEGLRDMFDRYGADGGMVKQQ